MSKVCLVIYSPFHYNLSSFLFKMLYIALYFSIRIVSHSVWSITYARLYTLWVYFLLLIAFSTQNLLPDSQSLQSLSHAYTNNYPLAPVELKKRDRASGIVPIMVLLCWHRSGHVAGAALKLCQAVLAVSPEIFPTFPLAKDFYKWHTLVINETAARLQEDSSSGEIDSSTRRVKVAPALRFGEMAMIVRGR